MADNVEYKNGAGDVTIVLDGENATAIFQTQSLGGRQIKVDGLNGSIEGTANLVLDDPSDGSSVNFDTGAVQVSATNSGQLSVTSASDDVHAALTTSQGLVIRNPVRKDRVVISKHGTIKLIDANENVRFEYSGGTFRIADSSGQTSFSVDGETGDVSYRGNLLKMP